MIRHHSVGRLGFTLIEMMIAMIITLMIVFAMVEAFRWVGESTTDGRAAIEMLGQIRHARYVLYEDLSRSTVPLDPWKTDPVNYRGYFEYIEGTGNDNPPAMSNTAARYLVRTAAGTLAYNYIVFPDPAVDPLPEQWRTLIGDLDDIVCLTVRNDEVPYRGRFMTEGPDNTYNTADDTMTIIESNLAEVIWWAELNDTDASGAWDLGETFTIHRRVLLIRPDLYVRQEASIPTFLVNNDISVHYHYDPTTHAYLGTRANSLGDLTYRHNRVAHPPIDYLLPLVVGGPAPANPPLGLSSNRVMSPIDVSLLPAYASADMRGEDVVISNVLAFDLRAWDPAVPIGGYNPGGEIPEGLVPGDPGYANAIAGATPNVQGNGAFVDLGSVDPNVPGNLPLYNAMVLFGGTQFAGGMMARSYLPAGNYVYDPWSIAYEKDGHDQDADGTAHEGTDGLDNDGVNGPDDLGERETSPPYPYPLQAFQARFRVYESDTRQVRQASQTVKFGK